MAEIAQLACMHSETLSQATVEKLIVTGVQEDEEDPWTLVTRKKKKKNDVLQVNKAVSSKKDPGFEATSKLHEKKGRGRRRGKRPPVWFSSGSPRHKGALFSGPFFVRF